MGLAGIALLVLGLLPRGRSRPGRDRRVPRASPDHRGGATSSIGASLHMIGRYEEAIATYEQARALGGDLRTIDGNIQARARRG